MKTIYLDNNATTSVAPSVISVMTPYFTEKWGNPSSMHRFGGLIARDIEQARASVADLLNCNKDEIIFTSCGTESNNTALMGFALSRGFENTKIVTTAVEHPAILQTVEALESYGAKVWRASVNSKGELDVEELLSHVDSDTIVSVMWANNETGVIFPIKEIAEGVKARGGVMHTDAVQAVGKLPIDLSDTPVDMLSLSGHKLHAPKGVGSLYIRKGCSIATFMNGGHQESGRRAGTENVPYIIGLGEACRLAKENLPKEFEHTKKLRDRLEEALLKSCKGAVVNGYGADRLPNTLNISFEFIEGEAILLFLDEYGVAASSGSACTTGSLEPSHVMRAMGLPYTLAHSSIRFSFSSENSDSDVETIISVLPSIVDRLRKLSPFVND